MKKKTIALLVIVLQITGFILAGCQSNQKEALEKAPPQDNMLRKEAKKSAASQATTEEEAGKTVTKDENEIAKKKKRNLKIIKNARIKFRVEEYEKSYQSILALVDEYDAYISSENAVNNQYQLYNDMEMRVLSDRFDLFLKALMKQALYVDYKKVSADDVTDQFVDLQARLKAKKEVEARFKSILNRANSIEQILKVENEIKKIREEIEAVEGRLKYLSDKVSYSTIKLYLYEETDYKSPPEKGFFAKMANALMAGWKGLQTFIVGVFYLWPLWLILGGTLWLVLRLVKRKSKKKK